MNSEKLRVVFNYWSLTLMKRKKNKFSLWFSFVPFDKVQFIGNHLSATRFLPYFIQFPLFWCRLYDSHIALASSVCTVSCLRYIWNNNSEMRNNYYLTFTIFECTRYVYDYSPKSIVFSFEIQSSSLLNIGRMYFTSRSSF